jgi:hypothetical protein
VFDGGGSTERKQGSSAMTQNGGGSLTPLPGTGSVSNGGRTPSECGGARLQSSNNSEGERKKEEWESVAVRVCCFRASTGGFYRHGRAWELGFPVACWGGGWRRALAKPGAAALGVCWRGMVSVSGHCGHALASSRRSASCREQRDREGGVRAVFLHVSRPGSGQGRLRLDRGMSTSMATGLGRR